MSGLFVSQHPFPFQVWPDFGELLRPLTLSCFFLLSLRRLFLLALPLLLGTPFFHRGVHPSSPCSRSDPPLTRQGAVLAHLDSLLSYDLVLWTDGSVAFSFGKGGFGILTNCSFCGTEATLSFSAGPVCSSFSAEACAILQALRWSRQHQQLRHFSSPPI